MRKFSHRASKLLNVISLILTLVTKIVLLPLKVFKTVLEITEEIEK